MSTAIITRTKNRGLLLKRALLSVANQTSKDYTHIIVNDGGEESHISNALKVLTPEQIKRVLVLHLPKSLGMEAASNHGIKNSTSEFVVIHDDDDSWEPTFLEKTTTFLTNHKQYKGVVTRTFSIGETIYKERVKYLWGRIFKAKVHSILLAETCYENTFAPISFIYRREVFNSIGFYDESLPVLGDWDFNLRFLTKFDIGYITDILANYHIRNSSQLGNSVTIGASKHIEYHAILCNKLLRYDISCTTVGLGFLVANRTVNIPRSIPKRILDCYLKLKSRFHPQLKVLRKRYDNRFR